jgi:hypothetical protein
MATWTKAQQPGKLPQMRALALRGRRREDALPLEAASFSVLNDNPPTKRKQRT